MLFYRQFNIQRALGRRRFREMGVCWKREERGLRSFELKGYKRLTMVLDGFLQVVSTNIRSSAASCPARRTRTRSFTACVSLLPTLSSPSPDSGISCRSSASSRRPPARSSRSMSYVLLKSYSWHLV